MTSLPPPDGPILQEPSRADIRTVAKGGAIQFVGYGINRVANLIFVAVAVRILGPSAFGLYRQVAHLLQMTTNFSPAGFDIAAQREITHARASADPGGVRGAARFAMTSAGIVSGVMFLLLFLAAEHIAGVFADEPGQAREMAFLIRLGAVFVPIYSITVVIRMATRGFKTNVPSVVIGNIAQPISLVIVSVGALMLGFGVAGAVIGLVASAAVSLVVGIWYFGRIRTEAEKHARPRTPVRKMVRFAIPQAGVSLFRVGAIGPAILVIGYLSTDREAGLYAIANSLQGIATIFPQALLSLWSPMVADLHYRKHMDRLEALYQTVNRWMASFSFLAIVALALQPEFFVRVLAGQTATDAALVTSLLAVGTLFAVATGPCGQLITMTGYPAVNLVNSVVGVLLFIAGAWWLVPEHGAVGMAIVEIMLMVLLNLLRVIEAYVLTGIQPFGRSFLKPLAAALVAVGILGVWRMVPGNGIPVALAGLVLASGAYVAVLLIAGVDPEDRFVYDRFRVKLGSVWNWRGWRS